MRIFYTVAHWIIGLLLGISTAFQLLAMFGGVLFNQYNNLPETIPWLVPVWAAALVLLIVAYILLVTKAATFPFQPIILALALIGAVAAFVAAITASQRGSACNCVAKSIAIANKVSIIHSPFHSTESTVPCIIQLRASSMRIVA